MKEKRRIFILAVVACFCTLVMQAQEVKSVSLDSIPKASLPKEGMSFKEGMSLEYFVLRSVDFLYFKANLITLNRMHLGCRKKENL